VRRRRFFRYRRMMLVMPPSDSHKFYLTDSDTVVELHWRAPEKRKGRTLFVRLAGWLSGPRPGPWHSVDHRAFETAVDTLSTSPEAACITFEKLGYEVTLDRGEVRMAA
jgi:hypothetical protein